jgi:hypothetical protein
VTTFATSISDWLAERAHAVTDWAGPSWNAAAEWLQHHAAGPLAWARPHSREIAVAAAAAFTVGIAMWALRSLRRGRQLGRTLAEATLDRDAKTHWLTLEIVMRNFQRHPLLVRSVEIIDPPGTKICDRWQAWRPETASVKFVAPELDLTGSASIETTIFPYNSNDYANQAPGAYVPAHAHACLSAKARAGLNESGNQATPKIVDLLRCPLGYASDGYSSILE